MQHDYASISIAIRGFRHSQCIILTVRIYVPPIIIVTRHEKNTSKRRPLRLLFLEFIVIARPARNPTTNHSPVAERDSCTLKCINIFIFSCCLVTAGSGSSIIHSRTWRTFTLQAYIATGSLQYWSRASKYRSSQNIIGIRAEKRTFHSSLYLSTSPNLTRCTFVSKVSKYDWLMNRNTQD